MISLALPQWEEGARQRVVAFCRWWAVACGYTRTPLPLHATLFPCSFRRRTTPRLASSLTRRFPPGCFLPELLLFLLANLCFLPAIAQIPPDTTDADGAVETILEDLDDTLGDPAQLAETLDDLRLHPLDVNTASADELAQIPVFGPILARNIILFRSNTGPLASLDALRTVEGMTETALHAARPFLTVALPEEKEPFSFSRLLQNLQVEWIQRAGRRLDLGRGYHGDTTRTPYAGSPDRLYTRLRLRSQRHLRLAVALEKDPGERFVWDPATRTYGFDHLTAHLALHDLGWLKTLVVGDYVVNAGQGVTLWRSNAFGKGRDAVHPLVRAGEGPVAYSSTDENLFFRGLAITMRLAPGIVTSAFASRRALDATIAEASLEEDTAGVALAEAITFSLSGLHRTPTEHARKDAVREDLLGGILDVRRGHVRLGMAGYRSRFSRPFRPGNAPHQRYLFTGRRATMVGAYANVFLGAVHLFGEAARSPEALGGVGGLTIHLAERAEAIVLARHYPRDFVSLHGYAFGERNGATSNETGYYVGLEVQPAPAWRVAAFFDQFRFPWVRFGVPRPSAGYEAFVLIEHRPRRWLTVYVQGRSETKEAGTLHTDARGRRLDAVRPETRQTLRLHGDYRFSPRLRLRARLEAVRFTTPDTPDAYGLVLYQDVRWHPIKTLQLDLRLAFFDTDSFEARVFTYENDLLYTFSVPAFAGRGHRAYALLQWSPTNRITVQLKAAVTRLEEVQTIGSGLDEVEGNRLREVRAQLRWRL